MLVVGARPQFVKADPAYNLGIGGTNAAVRLGEMTAALAAVIARETPAAVVVVGDTNSTLAGALAAACSRAPLVHVEAGMRSGDWTMPEERNRVFADRLARLLLCPHDGAVANLAREGIVAGVEVVGDVMYEIAATACDRLAPEKYLAALGLRPGAYVYVTVHREENAGDPARLARIARALGVLPLPA
jgi:UDP-GlcNAc3NAcA epimerase